MYKTYIGLLIKVIASNYSNVGEFDFLLKI